MSTHIRSSIFFEIPLICLSRKLTHYHIICQSPPEQMKFYCSENMKQNNVIQENILSEEKRIE